ncbi:MAG: DUF1036 domain-containing protein, partial [Deltaproteobacteria bacterium]
MKRLRTLLSTILTVGFCIASSVGVASNSNADTKIKYCNKNQEKIFLSIGYKTSAEAAIMSRGWWAIEAGKCSELAFPILVDKFYVHAQSSSQIYHWLGETALCVNAVDAYDLENAATVACDQAIQEKRKFKELSVAELVARAGTGMPTYEFNPVEATRVSGGLKFCNDTEEDLYLSYAQRKLGDQKTLVRGWFKTLPGKCFEAARDKEANEVLFYAQNPDAKLKWKGNIPLCTDDYNGYNFEDASKMACDLNNQRAQLFNLQKLPSTGDFEHHFVAQDAHSARSVVEICNSRSEKSIIAIAWKDSDFPGQVISKGWYVVEGGKCMNKQVID